MKIKKEILVDYIQCIFIQMGLNKDDSKIMTSHLVTADMKGIHSHGISRIKIYAERFANNLIENKPFEIEKDYHTSVLINGNNNFGIITAQNAMNIAMERAKKYGMSIVSVHNSNHCGTLGYYTELAAQKGLISFATTNAPSNMPPFGGIEKFFGTNPLSYGIPSPFNSQIVFDMATSVVARGKITYAYKNNKKIPLGWAITKEGNPTTIPKEALSGMVLPVGGAKGYGLAFLVDILSGVFSQASYGPHVGSLKDFTKEQNVGHFFYVMRADLFEDLESFLNKIYDFVIDLKKVRKGENVKRIYFPGELEHEKFIDSDINGVDVPKAIIDELTILGKSLNIKKELIYC